MFRQYKTIVSDFLFFYSHWLPCHTIDYQTKQLTKQMIQQQQQQVGHSNNNNNNNNKHLSKYHPIIVCILYYCIVIVSSIVLHDIVYDTIIIPILLWLLKRRRQGIPNNNNTISSSSLTSTSTTCSSSSSIASSSCWVEDDSSMAQQQQQQELEEFRIVMMRMGTFFLLYAISILIWRLYFRYETYVNNTNTSNNNTDNKTTNKNTNTNSNNSIHNNHQDISTPTPSNITTTTTTKPRYPYIVLYEYCWLCNVTLILSGIVLLLPTLTTQNGNIDSNINNNNNIVSTTTTTTTPILTSSSSRIPILIAYCCMIGIDQLLWYIDLVLYCIYGYCPIGVASYVFTTTTTQSTDTTNKNHTSSNNNNNNNRSTTCSSHHQMKKIQKKKKNSKHIRNQHWSNRITWTHHLWTIPCILYVLGACIRVQQQQSSSSVWCYNNNTNYEYILNIIGIYILSMLYLIINVSVSRYLIPFQIVLPCLPKTIIATTGTTIPAVTTTSATTTNISNVAANEDGDVNMYEMYYCNINLSYEVYQDIQHISLLRISTTTTTNSETWYNSYCYIVALLIRWQCFNTIIMIVLFYSINYTYCH